MDTCFQVSTTLDRGCWLLFAAAFAFVSVGQAVMRSGHTALENRSALASTAVRKDTAPSFVEAALGSMDASDAGGHAAESGDGGRDSTPHESLVSLKLIEWVDDDQYMGL